MAVARTLLRNLATVTRDPGAMFVTSFGESTGTMLGIFDGPVFGTVQERLDPGDHLVLYTDGVTEAESPDGEMLEDDGFIEMLREISGGDSVAICKHVCKRVLEFQGDSQSDDVTVLVLGRPTA
jgi:sigma-B regulation protein RsbU (phosphoserine phosphatase)